MLDAVGKDAAVRVVSWLSWITNAFQEGSAGSMVSGSLRACFLDFIVQAYTDSRCAES
jgi:hypothetical protein